MQVTVSMLAEKEVCLYEPIDRADVSVYVSGFDDRRSRVSWILPSPLVELYHWVWGEGTGGREDWRPQGDLS